MRDERGGLMTPGRRDPRKAARREGRGISPSCGPGGATFLRDRQCSDITSGALSRQASSRQASCLPAPRAPGPKAPDLALGTVLRRVAS